jgi:hypothetical protein
MFPRHPARCSKIPVFLMGKDGYHLLPINNYQKIVEKDFIYYNIIAIKWGESTHFF